MFMFNAKPESSNNYGEACRMNKEGIEKLC